MDLMQCPTCGSPLPYKRGQKNVSCNSGHHFDEAKEGYLYLLMSHQKNSKNPGDSKDMLMARQRFLERDIYLPVAERLADLLAEHSGNDLTPLIDIGCGEGYYLQRIYHLLCQRLGSNPPLEVEQFIGVDISKEAIRLASKRLFDFRFCVASSAHLPFQTTSAKAILGVFSPLDYSECWRVLKQEGCVFYVYPLGNHLLELKDLIYNGHIKEKDYKKYLTPPNGFQLVASEFIEYTVELDVHATSDLLRMTPHFWRIRHEDRERALQSSFKALTISMGIVVYQKQV